MAQKKGGDKGEKADPDSVVELYGKVYPELVFPSSSGATSYRSTYSMTRALMSLSVAASTAPARSFTPHVLTWTPNVST